MGIKEVLFALTAVSVLVFLIISSYAKEKHETNHKMITLIGNADEQTYIEQIHTNMDL